MDNNNNNKMEYNIEESQKRKERQEKVDDVKKKVNGFFDRLKEEREDRKRAKEEAARVKAEEKAEQEALMEAPSKPSNGGFSETTVTNKTISQPFVTKKVKPVLTEQEKRRRSKKWKKIFRNIMTIPEIIALIFLGLFLKDKYIDYSKNVHQTLTYSSDNYVYEIHRDNQDIKVIKSHRRDCAVAPCELDKISEYEVRFGKNQMTALRVFMDIKFLFKSTSKNVTIDDIKTDLGKRCIYGMIHNNDYFLGFKTYSKFETVDSEQMGPYTQKGYKYEVVAEQKLLTISVGEKPSSGYGVVINTAFKKDDDLYIFVTEQKPEEGQSVSNVITHPMIKLSLEEAPKNIYVFNIESGDEYPNFDNPILPNPEPSMVQNRKIMGDIVGDLVGTLREETLKG